MTYREAGVNVIPAQHEHATAIAECLRDMARRDLFLSHQQRNHLNDVLLACDGEHIAGLAWTSPHVRGTQIDIRVLPQFRHRGIGRLLFDAVTEKVPKPWLASCDAAQSKSIEFLTHRRFTMDGAVYAMRWDGRPEDVPPAFKSARILETNDSARIQALFEHSYDGHWLRPPDARTTVSDGCMLLEARVEGQTAGAAMIHRTADTYVLVGLCTHNDFRQRGVGRGLLCALMKRAGEQELGLVARVDSADDVLKEWAQRLGFWSYRTWLYFSRLS